jgi:hypothetical protein
MGYNKKHVDIVAGIWDKSGDRNMVCPQCGGKMVMIQIEPIDNFENMYMTYDTVIECTKCNFQVKTESFTILGSVKNFDLKYIEIASWAPSGSRNISNYEHVLDFELLKKLKQSGELKEFLIVNRFVVQVIG